ncbi:hypothetical protein L1887_17608 [Cichorium endivia]|nr:hypothetical protein L1887_17608 [Cichorium endivia]
MQKYEVKRGSESEPAKALLADELQKHDPLLAYYCKLIFKKSTRYSLSLLSSSLKPTTILLGIFKFRSNRLFKFEFGENSELITPTRGFNRENCRGSTMESALRQSLALSALQDKAWRYQLYNTSVVDSVVDQYGSVYKRGTAGFVALDNHKNHASVIQSLSRKGTHHAHLLKFQSKDFLPDNSTLTALMLYHANNGYFTEADAIWHEIINSSYNLDVQIVFSLIDSYIEAGLFHEVIRIIHQISLRHPQLQHQVYSHAVSSFGNIGELDLMENTIKEMASKGFHIDYVMGNAYVVYYSRFGSIPMMENAYKRLKISRILIEKDAIMAISYAYIRDKKFHNLGKFLRDVGLGRKNCGNLLWNLLLLSYAANFKMKSLQREFLNMLEAGFEPDLTTFNIWAVAFSKMSLFWDLHLSLDHMKHNGVVPDLVTYGCVVDAYLDRRLGKNLEAYGYELADFDV